MQRDPHGQCTAAATMTPTRLAGLGYNHRAKELVADVGGTHCCRVG